MGWIRLEIIDNIYPEIIWVEPWDNSKNYPKEEDLFQDKILTGVFPTVLRVSGNTPKARVEEGLPHLAAACTDSSPWHQVGCLPKVSVLWKTKI